MYIKRDKVPKLPKEIYDDDDEDELVTAYRVKNLERKSKQDKAKEEEERKAKEKLEKEKKVVDVEEDNVVPLLPVEEAEEEDEVDSEESSVLDSDEEEEGIVCCLCRQSEMVSPHISQCGHICCQDCWHTWLSRSTVCPECRSPVSIEMLEPVPVCGICEQILMAPQLPGWAAPCGHQCCRPCWEIYLADIQVSLIYYRIS